MWLNRRTEEPSVTDKECYWKKPRLSQIGIGKQFTLASEIKVGKKPSVLQRKTVNASFPDNSSFLNEVVNKLIERKVNVQLSKYKIGLADIYKISIHQLVTKFLSNDNTSDDDFLTFTKKIVNENLCNEAEKLTEDQSDDILWYEFQAYFYINIVLLSLQISYVYNF